MPFKKGETPKGAKPFQKGQSGNPAGRPPGLRNMKTILRDILEVRLKNEPDPVIPEDARDMTVAEKLMLNWVSRGLADADLKAIKDIFEAMEGKAHQAVTAETFNVNTDVDGAEVTKVLGALSDGVVAELTAVLKKHGAK